MAPRAAREVKANLTQSRLPDDPRRLHVIINLHPEKLERLIPELLESERLRKLREFIS